MLDVKVVADYLSKPAADVIQDSLRALLVREVSVIEVDESVRHVLNYLAPTVRANANRA